MFVIFRYALARLRGQILGWGIAIFLLGLLILSFYDTVIEQSAQIEALLESFPPGMMAFFGDIDTFATPEGYLSIRYFSLMPIILGVFAILVGSGLLASDEESGVLDLVLAHPISRTALFFGRFLAFVVALAAILLFAWFGLLLPTYWTQFDVSGGALALPLLSLGGMLLFYGSLALLFSMLLPSRRLAASTAGLLLIAGYFVTSLAELDTSLETIATFSPFTYYQSGDAILGLNTGWVIGLVSLAGLFTVLAWWRFRERDIRVAGEGGWNIAYRWRRVRAQ